MLFAAIELIVSPFAVLEREVLVSCSPKLGEQLTNFKFRK